MSMYIIGVLVAVLLVGASFLFLQGKKAEPAESEQKQKKTKPAKSQKQKPTRTKKTVKGSSRSGKERYVPSHPWFSAARREHKGAITAVAFPACPKGRFLATADNDRSLFLWNIDTLCEKVTRHHKAPTEFDYCTAMTFSDDGRYLIGCTFESRSILAYGVQAKKSGDEKKGTQLLKSLPSPHTSTIRSVCLPNDASFIVTCGSDTMVHISDKKGDVLKSINMNQVENYWASVSPDGTMLAVGTFTSTPTIMQITKGKDGSVSGAKKMMLLSKNGHKAGVTWLGFEHSSNAIVTVSNEGRWKRWSLDVAWERGEDARVIGEGGVDGASFSTAALSNGRELLALAEHRAIFVFDLNSGDKIGEIKDSHAGEVTSLSWSADGTLLASGDTTGTVHIWTIP